MIEDAIATVEAMKGTSAPGFERLWGRTRAVLIVPNLARGGWIIGGEFGNGLLLVRRADAAEWSDPVFFTLASGSVGLQIGADLSQLMLVITADLALDKLLTGRVRLGADVGFAAGPVGRGAQIGRIVDDELAEIYALSIARGGLFGGVALKGGILLPNQVANAEFYGADTRPAEIVRRPPGVSDGTLRLRAGLSGFLDGLAPGRLRNAQSEAAESADAEHVKGLPEHYRTPENTSASSGIQHRHGPSTADRLFKATSLSANDLENTRRTPVESPPLSSREEQIVNSLRSELR